MLTQRAAAASKYTPSLSSPSSHKSAFDPCAHPCLFSEQAQTAAFAVCGNQARADCWPRKTKTRNRGCQSTCPSAATRREWLYCRTIPCSRIFRRCSSVGEQEGSKGSIENCASTYGQYQKEQHRPADYRRARLRRPRALGHHG